MALLQVACGLGLYLALALHQNIASACLAVVYTAAAAWPLLYLFADDSDRDAPSIVLIYVTIGLSLAGVVALAGTALGISILQAIAAYGIALYGAALGRRFLRPGSHEPPRMRSTASIPLRAIAPALALCCLGVAPTLVYAIYMGRGDYPAVFFNADNPYHLSHVWSLLHEPGYPLMSMGVYGERRVYQYGGQAAAAVFSATTGVGPHCAYLGVMFPIVKVGAIAAAWRFGRTIWPRVPMWMSAGTLAVVSRFPVDMRELAAAWQAVTGRWPATPPINLFDIDHVLTNFGMFGALVVLANVAQENGARSLRFPALAALALLPVFKMSFFLGLGAAFGAWCLVLGLRRSSVRPLLPGAVTLAAAILVIQVLQLASGYTAGGLVISPLAHLRDVASPIARKIAGAFAEPYLAATLYSLRAIATEYATSFHWLLAAAAAALLAGRRRTSPYAAEWIAMAAAPVVFMNVFKYVRGPVDNESIRSSIYTTFTLVPYIVLAAAIAYVATRAPGLSAVRRRALPVLAGAYVGYFACTNVSAMVTLLTAPAVGYEHADNRAIAEALRAIPRDTAMVVTNDTRYPATDFAARDLQMQIPAIFGHRAYFVDGVNDRFDVAAARREKQERLREPAWDAGLTALAAAERWTHLLIRRDYPHPGDIPLALVFRNDVYAVYRF